MDDTAPARSAPRKVLRPQDDRVFAGVASGFARTFGIDPLLIRLGFVAVTLAGGAGILAYLVFAVGLPVDAGNGTAAPRDITGLVLRLALVVLLVVIVFGVLLFGVGGETSGGLVEATPAP